ncbi:MAG: hypothetical protein HeimC3_16760 [Candidatus Heimdallarchaeota archaeon LC_3]|nr:MAG: hypothetical protein HeimC3_16760 [Candidatus Heimdallarchaeota archaeon LC_3]
MSYNLSPMRRLRRVSHHKNTKREPGVYLLYKRKDGPVRYVGRSDTNLKRRLKNRMYARYHFQNTKSETEAYLLECILWHKYQSTIDNSKYNGGNHPAKPYNMYLSCPICRK